ncbi:hypothetical protein SISSUDRAFT_1057734 [Sistotremastrum suecicum HHB10207 ss-3]|uniref:F-box domain-containing protein n=1 Tax=Sistotremastrum suecicum HHB10207 ss-3 TaxID=1314776 RepID=A0A166I2J4_9AGAM|nr:hypothetical protein SISSUDRAFT_1057734 [Sistotremastrum suecicum HHB10207 ss-3]
MISGSLVRTLNRGAGILRINGHRLLSEPSTRNSLALFQNRIGYLPNFRQMSTNIAVPTTQIAYGKPIEHLASLSSVANPGELSFPDGVRHALVVDCGEQIPVTSSSDHEFLERIKNFVKEQDSQDVDFVRIQGLHPQNTPNELTWKALNGLRPRHLELCCGWHEEYEIEPLDSLDPSWPLESISIVGAAQYELAITKHFWTIPTLTFYYSHQVRLELPTDYTVEGPSALRHLTAIGNDACDMLARWRKSSISSICDNLESLRLESNNDCDFQTDNEYEDFVHALQGCTSVKSLELVMVEGPSSDNDPELDQHLRDQYQYLIDLPKYLPPNLEHLKFKSIPESARHLDVWLRCAKDPHWLPHLKSISLRFDMVNP